MMMAMVTTYRAPTMYPVLKKKKKSGLPHFIPNTTLEAAIIINAI